MRSNIQLEMHLANSAMPGLGHNFLEKISEYTMSMHNWFSILNALKWHFILKFFIGTFNFEWKLQNKSSARLMIEEIQVLKMYKNTISTLYKIETNCVVFVKC